MVETRFINLFIHGRVLYLDVVLVCLSLSVSLFVCLSLCLSLSVRTDFDRQTIGCVGNVEMANVCLSVCLYP